MRTGPMRTHHKTKGVARTDPQQHSENHGEVGRPQMDTPIFHLSLAGTRERADHFVAPPCSSGPPLLAQYPWGIHACPRYRTAITVTTSHVCPRLGSNFFWGLPNVKHLSFSVGLLAEHLFLLPPVLEFFVESEVLNSFQGYNKVVARSAAGNSQATLELSATSPTRRGAAFPRQQAQNQNKLAQQRGEAASLRVSSSS